MRERMKLFSWLRYATPLDRKLLLAVAILVAVSFALPLRREDGAQVIATVQDRVVFKAPLNIDRTVDLQGPLGTTVLQIAAGKVRILSSPCRNKTCVHMGEVHQDGDVLACLPNKLVVHVESKTLAGKTGHDFVSR